MKKIVLVLLLVIAASTYTEAHRHGHRHFSISIQTFYDELSPYGDWLYTPDYGYVWKPFFERPEYFRPYSSGGNWVYTEYGWTWVSDYSWGWAPFHYGRWTFDDYLGWMWIPGYEWGPGWVTWGSYNDYYGWAPLGPNINVSVNFNWYAPDPWWTFVPTHRFCSNNWHNYIYDRPVHITNITHITNVYVYNDQNRRNDNWFHGPRISDVERHTNHRVRQMRVVDNDRPDNLRADNDQVRVYRPEVEQRREESRPSNYRDMKSERRNTTSMRQDARSNNPGNTRMRSDNNELRNSERTRTENMPARSASPRENTNNERSNGSRYETPSGQSRNSSNTPDYRQERSRDQKNTEAGRQNQNNERQVARPSGNQVKEENKVNRSRETSEPRQSRNEGNPKVGKAKAETGNSSNQNRTEKRESSSKSSRSSGSSNDKSKENSPRR